MVCSLSPADIEASFSINAVAPGASGGRSGNARLSAPAGQTKERTSRKARPVFMQILFISHNSRVGRPKISAGPPGLGEIRASPALRNPALLAGHQFAPQMTTDVIRIVGARQHNLK